MGVPDAVLSGGPPGGDQVGVWVGEQLEQFVAERARPRLGDLLDALDEDPAEGQAGLGEEMVALLARVSGVVYEGDPPCARVRLPFLPHELEGRVNPPDWSEIAVDLGLHGGKRRHYLVVLQVPAVVDDLDPYPSHLPFQEPAPK